MLAEKQCDKCYRRQLLASLEDVVHILVTRSTMHFLRWKTELPFVHDAFVSLTAYRSVSSLLQVRGSAAIPGRIHTPASQPDQREGSAVRVMPDP